METSLVLKYILSYCFYLVHVIYYFCLAKINLFISIPYPNQVYDKQKKAFLSGDLRVLYSVMLWNIYFPGWRFSAFYGLHQHFFSRRQP